MKYYVLTGAGFSRNWGGWLASEAFEYLLGDPAVFSSKDLTALLWKHHRNNGGFEAALDELQRSASPAAWGLQQRLQQALRRMFDTMNAGFKLKSLEFQRGFLGDHPVRNFLLRFNAIFTLNQDLLFEYSYRDTVEELVNLNNSRAEPIWTLPGMRLIPDIGMFTPSGDHVISTGLQPIFKLHGSSNWLSAESKNMMILGGGKAQAIERYPVLSWYSQLFAEYISTPQSRLMIIGYGFRDEHINATLVQAINEGLKIFVIDPMGADAASVTNSLSKSAPGYKLTPFEESFQKALMGASRRPLSSTFGSDEGEWHKIERFFVE